jgi:putative transcriptional regulator
MILRKMKSTPSKPTSIKSKRGSKENRRGIAESKPGASTSPRPGRSIGQELVSRLARFAESLQKAEKIEDRFTCRTVHLNVGPRKYSPQLVKQARRQLRASQRVFASFLGVSVSTVRDWEQGLKPPGGAACRIMDEIRRDPDYWLARLRELSVSS